MSAHGGPASASGTAAGAVGLVASVFLTLMALVIVGALGGISWSTSAGSGDGATVAPSAIALRDIPPLYLRLYEQAAERYGLQWTVLAGIGKVECDHGRDRSPSCMVEGIRERSRGGRADAVSGVHVGGVRG